MNAEYCFCSVIESPQVATVSPVCNCPALAGCAGPVPATNVASRSADVTRVHRVSFSIIFPLLFVQSENESAAWRQRVLPVRGHRERSGGHLHGGVRAFRDQQPLWEFLERRQIQVHGQRFTGSIDSGDEPAFAGALRENGNLPRLAG